jgi:hypothetical protein
MVKIKGVTNFIDDLNEKLNFVEYMYSTEKRYLHHAIMYLINHLLSNFRAGCALIEPNPWIISLTRLFQKIHVQVTGLASD